MESMTGVAKTTVGLVYAGKRLPTCNKNQLRDIH
jgi:hypothetical protein